MNEIIVKSSLVFSLVFIASCSGPGAPLLRTSSADGEGELIQNCNNISNKSKVDSFITDFYLSTWGSAFAEGMQQGVKEGMPADMLKSIEEVIKAAGMPLSPLVLTGIDNGEILIQLINRPSPFCRIYFEDSKKVSESISRIIQNLGNDVLISDVDNGIFITDFIRRKHEISSSKYPVHWLDRYEILVKNKGSKKSVVTVYRDLYISREPGIFNQAISVGHNEGWIMTQITNKLAK